MILVTGGAGFIGANFVLDWLDHGGEPVSISIELTYAGNLGNLVSAQGRRATRVRARRYRRSCARREPARDASASRDRQFRRREPRRPLDPRPRGVHRDQRRRHIRTARRRARALRLHCRRRSGDQFRFLHVSTDEVYGSLGPRRRRHFRRRPPYAPNSPYSASKAAADHLVRAYHHTYGLPTLTTNCSNNYGPRQFPEKLIPLMIHNAHHGQAAAGVRRRRQRARLAVRRRSLRGHSRRARARAAGRDLQRRRQRRTHQSRCRRTLCRILGEPTARRATTRAQITFVKDRPGHDRRYAIDAAKISRELGWTPRETFEIGTRDAPSRWYLDNSDVARRGHQRRIPRSGSRSTTPPRGAAA